MSTTFSKVKVIKRAFSIYKHHFFSLIVIYALAVLIMWFVRQAMLEVLSLDPKYDVLVVAVNFLIQTFLMLGLVYMVIKLDENRPPSWRDFTDKINNFIQFAILLFIISVLFYMGLYFFIVPGFFFLALFLFAPYALLNENLNFYSALRRSISLGKGHRLNILLFLFMLFALAGILSALNVLMLVFVLPLINLSIAELYLLLSSQNNALDPELQVNISKLEKLLVYVLLALIFAYGVYLFRARTTVLLNRINNQLQNTNMQQADGNHNIDTEDKQALEKLQMALELYRDTYKRYPDTLQLLVSSDILKQDEISNFNYTLTDSGYTLCKGGLCVTIQY